MNSAQSGPLHYQRDKQRVHVIVHHCMWCPRRRKPVLVGEIAARCRALITAKCEEQRWTVLTLAMQPDNMHLFVRGWPTTSAADVVKDCKGVTSFTLRRGFPGLHTLPSMGTRAYFASSAGNVRQATMQRSIAAQTGR